MIHELAGKPAPRSILANIPRLMTAYYTGTPDPSDPSQRIAFGTSGHRGSSLKNSFNEDHILAICQAISEYRKARGFTGPLFLGMDTHALSEAAFVTALEVFAGNGLRVMIQKGRGYTPTPVISHAILTYNRRRNTGLADGVVITPSHNPPEDGGFKYNPPEGGPADTETTAAIERRANQILADGMKGVMRTSLTKALRSSSTVETDFVSPYIQDLPAIVDLAIVARKGLRLGVDPMGGSSLPFWEPMAKAYGLNLEVVNPVVDPTFSFMTVDKDGKIRMDCSSPYAMAGLIHLKDRFDVAFGNDPDADRHGIVTRQAGLLNPNDYLAVAVWYLFQNRPQWSPATAVGKTLVSSSMIDRVAAHLGRKLVEVPVGFKWFVPGLLEGSLGFAGEESAGASFLRMDGSVWATDKDGIIMDLLAAEITAKTGKDPAELYRDLEGKFGRAAYKRLDVPASAEQRAILQRLTPEMVPAKDLAGDPIIAKLTRAPGNNASIGGLKVLSSQAWFAARPSGTEDIYKIYLESFRGDDHLARVEAQALSLIQEIFAKAGGS